MGTNSQFSQTGCTPWGQPFSTEERGGEFSQSVLFIRMPKERIFCIGYRSSIRTGRVAIHSVNQQDPSVLASQQPLHLKDIPYAFNALQVSRVIILMYRIKGTTEWTEYPGSHYLTNISDFTSYLVILKR